MHHTRLNSVVVFSSVLLLPLIGNAVSAAEKERSAIAVGKEVFTREWLAGDRRSHGGDGLGPLFNARSCVECHHQGGIGGAGARHTNARIASAVLVADAGQQPGLLAMLFGARPKPANPAQQPDRAKLAEIHPSLRTENSFPLHRFGTAKEFTKWQSEQFGFSINFGEPAKQQEMIVEQGLAMSLNGLNTNARSVGNSTVQLIVSERNTPPLFGLGLIDRIPERVLVEVAVAQTRAARKSAGSKARSREVEHPLPVMGRVARLRDGRAGRFGWKAQTATLRDFTLQACASELGLEVPGFSQSPLPWKPAYKAPGLDLNAGQCDALVQFVAALPVPQRRMGETEQHAAETAQGEKVFTRIGCAECHRRKLGEVEGIFSDLLLHDMGQELSDHGEYGVTSTPGQGPADGPEPLPVFDMTGRVSKNQSRPKFAATAREWRTPPLWGLRNSAPYLHDGRADTIAAAVGFHAGEAQESATRFFGLTLAERQQIELFLKSLAAPGQ